LASAERGAVNLTTFASVPKVGDTYGITDVSTIGPIQIRQTPGINPPNSRFEFSAPFLLVIPASATLPAVWIAAWGRRRERTRRSALGLCSTCGYDLRASTDRCPECGTAISPKAAQV
jgi:uncharacterized paraquat-inducible protein A